MSNRSHSLFAQHPLNGQHTLSVGQVPTPYHVYDGHGTLIGGLAELSPIRNLLCNGRGLQPRTAWSQCRASAWFHQSGRRAEAVFISGFGESVANFNFQPTFIEHFAPFRFVYLFPEAVTGEQK